eukprot:TRINITY_DN5910_c0_g4_i1.p1 TRINITY_DN5910_c0_g4~~TRINITY_DN5910_c0_g4_i1.p1  ORF type:complete len:180 (+),score=20.30 TRINITY_DN5910_c0_g4_i1:81-542(+)
MSTYSLQSDSILTSLVGQSLPATVWYRFVAGINAQLRTAQRGNLRRSLAVVVKWLASHINPTFREYGIRIDLASFQAVASGKYQLGIIMAEVDRTQEEVEDTSPFPESPGLITPAASIRPFPPNEGFNRPHPMDDPEPVSHQISRLLVPLFPH